MRFTRQWNQIKQNQKTRLNGMRRITDITGDIYIRDLQEKISLKKKKTREDRTG